MTDKTETAADGGVDETAADGGVNEAAADAGRVNGGFDEPDSAIKNQFDVIRKSRRRRVVGWALLAGVLGYLLSQGASATEMLETEFRWDAFGDALTQYFPITSYWGVPFVDVGEYVDFVLALDLLYDPEVGNLLFQWPPDLYAFFVQKLGIFTIFGEAGTTLAMGFVGTLIGFPLALVFSILASERVSRFSFNFTLRGIMSFIRAIPAIIWALIFVPLVGLGATAATLAIGLNTIGNLGRLFVEDLEELEEGPIEAMRTTGANKPQIVFFGMLSQVRTSFIAWTLYIFEINVRSAVTVGVLGAGGLGAIVSAQRSQFNYTDMMAALICIFLLIMTVEIFSQRLRARLRSDEEKQGLWELVTGFPQRMADSALR